VSEVSLIPEARQSSDELLHVEHLKVHFPIRRGVLRRRVGQVRAVDDVTFDIRRGETFGLVGESGCGKSTIARAILQLHRPTSGRVVFNSGDLAALSRRDLRALRRQVQMIFQDPYASLNPRMSVGDALSEPLRVHHIGDRHSRRSRVAGLLTTVGLDPSFTNRYPHEFSGGQRQRIGIARALALQPSLIVCDEPVSALDVSIRAQIVNLLIDLQADLGLAYLFIAHDLSVVRHISDRIGVMYLGKLVEVSPAEELYVSPLHPYTKALLSAVPIPDPQLEAQRDQDRIILFGDLPSPANPPTGCRFHTRCPFVQPDACTEVEPELRELTPAHSVACHFAEQILAGTMIANEETARAGMSADSVIGNTRPPADYLPPADWHQI